MPIFPIQVDMIQGSKERWSGDWNLVRFWLEYAFSTFLPSLKSLMRTDESVGQLGWNSWVCINHISELMKTPIDHLSNECRYWGRHIGKKWYLIEKDCHVKATLNKNCPTLFIKLIFRILFFQRMRRCFSFKIPRPNTKILSYRALHKGLFWRIIIFSL